MKTTRSCLAPDQVLVPGYPDSRSSTGALIFVVLQSLFVFSVLFLPAFKTRSISEVVVQGVWDVG